MEDFIAWMGFLAFLGLIFNVFGWLIATSVTNEEDRIWFAAAWSKFRKAKNNKEYALGALRNGRSYRFSDEQEAKDALRQAVSDRFWSGLLAVVLVLFWYVVIPAQIVYACYTALLGKSAERKEINNYLKTPTTPQDRVN